MLPYDVLGGAFEEAHSTSVILSKGNMKIDSGLDTVLFLMMDVTAPNILLQGFSPSEILLEPITAFLVKGR